VIQGKARLRLTPGTFRKQEDIVIDGHTDVDVTVRFGDGPFAVQARVDATRANFRITDVFEKQVGMRLVLDADVAPTDGGIAVRDARGYLDHIAITGHADIGRAPAPGGSTSFGLYFGTMDIDLARAPTLVAATAPFAIAGGARVERLDILRRPDEKRQWQVTLDASLAEVHARLPLGDGRAHVVDALSADVHIEPGLLRVQDATTHVNGVPLSLEGTAGDFMALISGDRDRPRADIEVAVRGDAIDLDELLTPGEVASGAGDGVSGTAAGEDTQADAGPSRPFPQRVTVRTGTLDAPEATYFGQPLSDLHLTIGYVPSTLRIDAARFGLHGGRGEVTGSVAVDDGPGFALDVDFQDVRLREALATVSPAQPLAAQGIVDGRVSFRTRGAGVAAWRKTVEGAGTVTVRDGVLPRFNLIDVVARAMLGVFSFVPGANDVSLGGSNPFSKLEQVFHLSSAGLTADTVTLITDDYQLSGAGAITFDGELDYDTHVKLTARGTQRILTVVALPIPGSSHIMLPAIPVRVTGALSAPHISPEVSSLSVAPFRAIGNAGKDGVRAVGKGVRRLLGHRDGAADDSPAAAEATDPPAADAAEHDP